MTDKEPTREQVKEFWEWCGLKWFWNHNPECHCGEVDNDDSMRSWHYKEKGEWKLATRFWHEQMAIDLNNLFKYAVPKIRRYLNAQSEIDGIDTVKYPFHDFLKRWAYAIAIKDEDPATALFWALWEVIHLEEIA